MTEQYIKGIIDRYLDEEQWIFERYLDSGCHGLCFLVRRRQKPNEVCVLKALTNTYFYSPRCEKESLPCVKEIEALKRLNHLNIIKLIDYSLKPGSHWHITEYCSGGSIKDAGVVK